MATVKKRSPVGVLALFIVTFGIYGFYWIVKTKDEINSFGASIPSAWHLIVPVLNIIFYYKYAKGFSIYVKQDNRPLLWFLFYIFLMPVAIILIQQNLNRYAE